VEARRFRHPHHGSDDDAKAWEILRAVVAHVADRAAGLAST
jgi:hypothetical protein